jgi:alkanesulfonate monooxygenase SsuD/methylene tetrahydromethanopterin reductase-like flavin-dependent oxidoreductase (luciferase family)
MRRVRRGEFPARGYLAEEDRYRRAKQFVRATWTLFDSSHRDDVATDKRSRTFLRNPAASTFSHHDDHFDIDGRFTVTRGPQGRPMIIQPGSPNRRRQVSGQTAIMFL